MTMFRSRVTFFIVALGIFAAFQASASLEDVTYPVAELGNCASQDECFAYCGVAENYDACISFAEANELLEEEEIETYRTAEEALAQNGGPGGCTDQTSCESYCADVTHLEECLTFASENGLMSEEELGEAQQVLTALESGLSLPGGCSNQESCDAYCGDMAHMEECIAFASAAGMMSEEELVQAEAMLEILEAGGTPGGCTSQETCDAYCGDEANIEECLNFAVSAGMMTAEEAEQAREMGSKGKPEDFVGPGGCNSEESCRAYCEQEVNREECDSFFGDSGEAPEGNEYDDSEDSRDSFVGPGGCVGEEACMSYCSDAANQETCASFFGSQEDYEDEGFQVDGEPLLPDVEYEYEDEYDNQDESEYGGEGDSNEYKPDEGDYEDTYEYEY
ncbi:MAG: hypothetical protein AAB413_04325, partial [Patescibacteria group bacterium]